MIVGQDNRRGPVRYGISKNFAGVNLSFVDQTDGNHSGGDDFIGTIQGNTKKVFLFPIAVMANQGQHVDRGFNLDALRPDAAAGEFKGCCNQRGLSRAHTFKPLEINQIRSAVVVINQPDDTPGHGHDIMFFGAGAQQDGCQFLVR